MISDTTIYLVIVFAACCPHTTAVLSMRFVDYCRGTFDQIFGQNESVPAAMSERQLLQLLMLLRSRADMANLDEAEQAMVNFWYDIVMDYSSGNCNRNHLQKISDLHEHQNGKANPNFHQVYIIFRRNILEFCNNLFSDLPDKLDSRMPGSIDRLIDLLNIYSELASQHSGDMLAKKLDSPVKQMIGVGRRASGDTVTSAWANGPCEKVLSTLRAPEMRQYADFVDMSLSGPGDFLAHAAERTQLWVGIVKMCLAVDNLIQGISERSPVRSPILDIKYCFDGCFKSDST